MLLVFVLLTFLLVHMNSEPSRNRAGAAARLGMHIDSAPCVERAPCCGVAVCGTQDRHSRRVGVLHAARRPSLHRPAPRTPICLLLHTRRLRGDNKDKPSHAADQPATGTPFRPLGGESRVACVCQVWLRQAPLLPPAVKCCRLCGSIPRLL